MVGEEEDHVEEEEEVRVDEVEKLLGYSFRDRALLEEALTHPSYYKSYNSHPSPSSSSSFSEDPSSSSSFFSCSSSSSSEEEKDMEKEKEKEKRERKKKKKNMEKKGATYERLEFMGDAVIGCLVARDFFEEYRDLPPGSLTLLRGANVDTEKLARVAVCRGLHHHIRHKKPDLKSQIEQFEEDVAVIPINLKGLVNTPKVLADIVESLMGAVFIDSNSNLEVVWEIFKGLAKPWVKIETIERHPMSELYEFCQKKRMTLEFKDTWEENTEIAVLIDGNVIGSATYKGRKEIAQNRAAKNALENLKIASLRESDGG